MGACYIMMWTYRGFHTRNTSFETFTSDRGVRVYRIIDVQNVAIDFIIYIVGMYTIYYCCNSKLYSQ